MRKAILGTLAISALLLAGAGCGGAVETNVNGTVTTPSNQQGSTNPAGAPGGSVNGTTTTPTLTSTSSKSDIEAVNKATQDMANDLNGMSASIDSTQSAGVDL